MSNKIKVSIIVPVYNVPEKYLKKCLNSLIDQTLKDIEIILVDDGTPDTSGKICDEYAAKDKRIKVIHQENKGLSGARNTGCKNAHGQWIAFVDGDDWIAKEAYEQLYNIGKKEDVDIVMFGFTKDYPNRNITANYEKYFTNYKIYKTREDKKYLQTMILNYNANCATVNTKLIKKELIETNNIYHDEELRQGAEGIEFNIRLFSQAKSVLFLNKTYYHYIYNDKSITTVHNENNHFLVLNCFKKIKQEINLKDKELSKWFYNRMKYVVITTAISGFFSPTNKDKYSTQKKQFETYLNNELVQESLNNKDDFNLNIARKLTLFFIRKKLFIILKIISKIRYLENSK